MMIDSVWPMLLTALERDDLARRTWLASWFVTPLSRQPDILEQLWNGSRREDEDYIGWRWCEYRISTRSTFPHVFMAIYGPWIDSIYTAPVFVLRASCLHCDKEGFFVTDNISKADREIRGNPRGRCAACRRAAQSESVRRCRTNRRASRRR